MLFTKLSGTLLLALVASATWLATAGAATLFDASNIQTGTGNGANGANTSATAPNSNTLGYDVDGENETYALADDFVLPSLSQVATLVFDASLGSIYPNPPTSPFTAVTASIWNAQPGTTGATVLFTSTILSATAWTGIYRVSSGQLAGATCPVFTLSVGFTGVILPAGTYWASYSVTGFVGPGDPSILFAPPVMNTDGTQPTGNALQSSNGGLTWTRATDSLTRQAVGIPLQVIGNAVPEPSTVIWLSLATVGTVLVVRRRRAVA